MFPFYFSGINSSMLSADPGNSINLSWNMWNAKNAANSIMFMTPSLNTAFYDFPEVMTFGNSLLDPRLAIQQTLNSFNNGGWMNGMNAGGNWFNNIFKNPWENTGDSDTGKTDKEKAENKLMQKQYDKLKAVLKSYYENYKDLPDDQASILETALNKGGKIEEKLDALKAVYKELDSKELRKALLALDENKKALNDMGYNFSDTNYSFKNKEADEGIQRDITKIHDEITSSGDNRKYETLQNYVINADKNEGILKLISYWNDEYKDDENRSIIRLIANNMPTDSAAKTNAKNTVGDMVIAIVNKAKDVSYRIGNCDKLDNARKELETQLQVTKNSFDKGNLNTLATKFEEVYARIRIAEAEELSAKIKKDYAFLNDISDSDTDFVNAYLVVEDVKADLKAEGVTIPTDIDKFDDGAPKTVQEKVKDLVGNGDLRETDCKNPMVYYSEKTKKHYVIRDNKLIELTDVVRVYDNGRCNKADKKPMNISDVQGKEVDPDTLKTEKPSGTTKSSDSKADEKTGEKKTEENKTPNESLEAQAERLASDNPNLMGVRFCKDISGYTNDDEDFPRMQAYIKYVNKDNVEEFLKGYYAEKNCFDNGFFEQIAAEIGSTRLSNGEVVPVIKAIIDHYSDKSLSEKGQEALKEVKNCYEEYRDKEPNARFRNEDWSWFFRLGGCDILDKLDDAVETLLDDKLDTES